VTRYKVWDLPLRAFHWSLVLLVLLQWGTAQWEWLDMQWHTRFGYALLALLGFRLLWGFVGSDSARFANFLRGPRAVLAYARTAVRRSRWPGVGHNPLGAWSVVALLACLTLQAVSGLYTSDEILAEGPLVAHASSGWVEFMSDVHGINKNVLLGLIALHLAAVAWHALGKREELVSAMFSGRRRLPRDPGLRFAGVGRALVLLVVCAGLVVALVYWAQGWPL
jgi:cytochrome b